MSMELMSMRNGRRIVIAAIASISLMAASAAQAQASPGCRSAFFKAVLNAGENFERELGGGLLFRVRSQQPGWFLDIVPAEENTKDYVYPVNLPLRLNANQNLGPAYGETVQSSLTHPHEMNFLINRADYDRISGLIGNVLRSYQTADPDKALADYTNAVDDAHKGWLKVAIASYKTDPKKGEPTHIKLRVQITTPTDFQFAPKMNPLPWPCHP